MSEQAVIAYNATGPAAPLTALPVDPAVTLDYPYAMISGKPRANLEAAGLFRTALAADGNRDLFAKLGFRAADGSTSAGFPPAAAPPPPRSRSSPSPSRRRSTTSWGTGTPRPPPSRVLTLVDVTSSMNRPMAGGGSPSRLQVLRKTATDGLSLFTDDSELGLWAYASGLPSGKDYPGGRPPQPAQPGAAGQADHGRRRRQGRRDGRLRPV